MKVERRDGFKGVEGVKVSRCEGVRSQFVISVQIFRTTIEYYTGSHNSISSGGPGGNPCPSSSSNNRLCLSFFLFSPAVSFGRTAPSGAVCSLSPPPRPSYSAPKAPRAAPSPPPRVDQTALTKPLSSHVRRRGYLGG